MNETLVFIIEILALVFFIALIYPTIKAENWKEKFIENKHAKSILIVFVLIIGLMTLMGLYLDTFFPVEVIR